jgi:hypothetical protein
MESPFIRRELVKKDSQEFNFLSTVSFLMTSSGSYETHDPACQTF